MRRSRCYEKNGQGHRPRHHRRRPRRPVPRRGGGAPSGGEMDRARREEPQPRRRGRPQDRRRFRHPEPRRAAQAAGSHRLHHRHRRASARRPDHGGGRARPADADREAAGDRPEEIRAGAQGDQGRQARRRGRLHPALPPALAGGQGEMPQRRARRRHAGDLARLHEPAGGDRQLQAHRRPGDHLADGDLGHARARHLHVVPRRQDAGRVLRALDRQGAGPRLPGHRRHRRHDHVLRRHRLPPQHFLGAAGDLAGRGLFARGRHRRHHRRAHHRRHPPRHRAGGVEGAIAKATTRTPRGWSISWAAIRPATWRSANCAGRWRTRR